ncbi:alcohol dehydrogenase catalytic domain-containing protein [Paraburkholderia sp. 32]|uniref:alcohol dehydrogenase catalytic domain-containing protein n=1 Tax=Paraburkholderia sp. 32 TaxID=2991057 RepID=UPI003D240C8B
MKSIQLTGYGTPADVVKLVDVPDVGAAAPDEIVIDVEAAPVEPSDLYMIAGIYGNLPPLPHILGIQGVGRVSAAGSKVKHLKEGDRVLVPPFAPSWVERVKRAPPG